MKELIPYKVNAEPHNISHLSNSPSFQRFFADKSLAHENWNNSVGVQNVRCSSEPNKEILYKWQMKAIKHSESCDWREWWRREPFHMMPNTAWTNDHSKSNLPTPTIKLNLWNELKKKQLSSVSFSLIILFKYSCSHFYRLTERRTQKPDEWCLKLIKQKRPSPV